MSYPKRSLSEVLHLLRDAQQGKSITVFADELGVSKQYLSNVLHGNCPPSDRLLKNFGFERKWEPQYVQTKQKERNKMSTTTVEKIGCAHCPAEFDTDVELATHAQKDHADKLRRPKKGTKQRTLVNVILDKSGSMTTKVADVIGGFNTYVEELKKDKDSDFLFTLTLFDTDFVEKYLAEPLEQVKPLDTTSYRPEGNTALNDAIGRTIRLVEGDRREATKIITVIMTDGEENSSHEFSHESVKRLIEEKQKEGWSFIFLGASLDAWGQGMSYGVSPSNVARYNQDNYRETYAAVAHATSATSSGLAPSVACFAATPDSMLRSADLHVNTSGPSSSLSNPTFTRTTPSKPKQKKGWNLNKGRK